MFFWWAYDYSTRGLENGADNKQCAGCVFVSEQCWNTLIGTLVNL